MRFFLCLPRNVYHCFNCCLLFLLIIVLVVVLCCLSCCLSLFLLLLICSLFVHYPECHSGFPLSPSGLMLGDFPPSSPAIRITLLYLWYRACVFRDWRCKGTLNIYPFPNFFCIFSKKNFPASNLKTSLFCPPMQCTAFFWAKQRSPWIDTNWRTDEWVQRMSQIVRAVWRDKSLIDVNCLKIKNFPASNLSGVPDNACGVMGCS